jgi:hypothetical protein
MRFVWHQLVSSWKSFVISLQRNGDHIYRKIIGVPQLRYSEITPQLYLGGQYSKRGFRILKARGITGIVSMRMSPRKDLPDLGEIKFLHLPTKDQQAPTLEYLIRGANFIEQEVKNNGKVYIHCRAGEGRGPTMVAAYLIHTGLTLDDSLAQIRAVRRFIKPTTLQLERLKEMEKLSLLK